MATQMESPSKLSNKKILHKSESIKAIAKLKAKKMAKEDERKRELMKQFPKLFSPVKVKSTDKKRKDLLSPSMRRELGLDDSENTENTHHNIIVENRSGPTKLQGKA
jgi:hypothetical protein